MRIRTIWELGLRVRDRRLELGWSQAQLADRVGVTRQWIMNLEQGNAGAALGQVLQVLEVMRLDLHIRNRRSRSSTGDTSRPRRSVSYDDVAAFLDEVLQRTRDPEHENEPSEPPQRTPLRRREPE
jgi:HTH-type transcriptional regulator/antitoxin HipB